MPSNVRSARSARPGLRADRFGRASPDIDTPTASPRPSTATITSVIAFAPGALARSRERRRLRASERRACDRAPAYATAPCSLRQTALPRSLAPTSRWRGVAGRSELCRTRRFQDLTATRTGPRLLERLVNVGREQRNCATVAELGDRLAGSAQGRSGFIETATPTNVGKADEQPRVSHGRHLVPEETFRISELALGTLCLRAAREGQQSASL